MKKFNSFGPCLKSLLEECRMTQADLARKTGLSSSQIAHYIRDRYQPSPERVKEFEDAIGQGYTFYKSDNIWTFTQDLMKTLEAQHAKPLKEQLEGLEDGSRVALLGGFEEALKVASLIKQKLYAVREQSPYDIGYRYAEALEVLTLGYQRKVPKQVEETSTNDEEI